MAVPTRGIGAVLLTLTGIGSPWAQDPPWYADVVAFETGTELDWSHTRVRDWQGGYMIAGYTSITKVGLLLSAIAQTGRQIRKPRYFGIS